MLHRNLVRGFCLLASVLASSQAALAQTWALENHAYFNPVMAEPRAPQTTVLFPAVADGVPFAVNDGRGLVWDISVGTAVPIFGFGSSKGTESPVGVAPGEFGLGIWFPLSFHVLEDLGKDDSNPILNTDYRFAGLVKAQWGLPGNAVGTSSHLGAKFQFGHESTHIGDEFTLGALRTHPSQFIRVNVSYEYYDVAGSFEPNFGSDGEEQFKIRAGNVWLWRPADGWYARELLQPYGQFIAGSKRNHEPYLQVEWYRAPSQGYGPMVSVDFRNRTVYQYLPAPDANQTNAPEPTEWSTNLMVGWRPVSAGAGLQGRILPTYFLRYYHGVNPNGQFRSQAGFNEFGFGVHFTF